MGTREIQVIGDMVISQKMIRHKLFRETPTTLLKLLLAFLNENETFLSVGKNIYEETKKPW